MVVEGVQSRSLIRECQFSKEVKALGLQAIRDCITHYQSIGYQHTLTVAPYSAHAQMRYFFDNKYCSVLAGNLPLVMYARGNFKQIITKMDFQQNRVEWLDVPSICNALKTKDLQTVLWRGYFGKAKSCTEAQLSEDESPESFQIAVANPFVLTKD